MSSDIRKQDPLEVAQQAEQDLNSDDAKRGSKLSSDSTTESGVNEAAANRFEGSTVTYGSAASGSGDNREIPDDEGGGINPHTGRQTKAGDFEGEGGPEEKMEALAQDKGGDQEVVSNVR